MSTVPFHLDARLSTGGHHLKILITPPKCFDQLERDQDEYGHVLLQIQIETRKYSSDGAPHPVSLLARGRHSTRLSGIPRHFLEQLAQRLLT